MLNSIIGDSFSLGLFLICMACSILLGTVIALVHSRIGNSSRGFVMTIALLPAVVQMVITLVNGNLGTGVAVMGAFSLVRFRSVPGNAKEINSIFLAMTVGLATGTGYLAVAGLFVLIIEVVSILFYLINFGEPGKGEKDLKITIPESLDYTGAFDDLFEKYTKKHELLNVKTTNMGSLFRLDYRIHLKNVTEEKALLDEIRCRNGNLEISCGRVATGHEEL